ncbi:S-adenosylmethionine:tRNA ribosyltransferase-isomerase [Solidesulfovibrio carbinoliphilus subsp. oakridgensis]|uniref:S-adenosylmethionine:tRNA ribosyltransferase-isomerase n=1 Tax=Solidesulfovibrio carbinoliphilus subsp. oakridgensis TaxID=694327 RepID=G7Q965_9BACT|nr:tRNA preQ1(34) S-adenosylmethionine ribosyltransferase-isomerase QueA [Solidesulfovibrio carbinoliphilus]EHJ47787.1 S-adenosylmethionine:tRNA ribosyltransferase-isomerase [Solidesulfovibrio carbinoliphilus subsp. oakridgensis]
MPNPLDSAPAPDDLLAAYHFDLPEDRIANRPCARRDACRLMTVNRATGAVGDAVFADLPDLLPEGALLVANNTKVAPVRLLGRKPTGGAAEFLLVTPIALLRATTDPATGWTSAPAAGLLRVSRPPRPGDRIDFAPDLCITATRRGAFGHTEVVLSWQGSLPAVMDRIGHVPLPPYIRRADDAADRETYQTVYASDDKLGSAAAPTAGLHFTEDLLERLRARGFGFATVTCHVGIGTFSPVRVADIREHAMHREWIEVPQEAATAVLAAKAAGRPVVAVGTTAARTLEGVVREAGEVRPFAGETDIFIRPGHAFQVVDGMVTNFHLPGSSLVIMLAALVGRENLLAAYARAIASGYRFFSYGDAMLAL